MREVRRGLHVSNWEDSCDASLLKSAQISHVLSLYGLGRFQDSPSEVPSRLSSNGISHFVNRLYVSILDTEDENLLEVLDQCLSFIEKGKKKGSVLVHCQAGISRSPAVIVAYLMRKEGLSCEEALKELRKVSPTASPNDGFLKQLSIFGEMGSRIDRNHPSYKQFQVQQLGTTFTQTGTVQIDNFAADPNSPPVLHTPSPSPSPTPTMTSSSSSSEIPSVSVQVSVPGTETEGEREGEREGEGEKSVVKDPPTSFYRCKKCRRLLITSENSLFHDPGEGAVPLWHRGGGGGGGGGEGSRIICSSIFVEPMQWMKEVNDGSVEGKLGCPTCSTRLGNYNWCGLKCSCGAWITPAFQLHKSRMDKSLD